MRAPAAGTVSFVGSVPGGRHARSRSRRPTATRSPCSSSVARACSRGDDVAEGAVVGAVGQSADAVTAAAHVHLGVRVAADPNGYVDPLDAAPCAPGGGCRPRSRRRCRRLRPRLIRRLLRLRLRRRPRRLRPRRASSRCHLPPPSRSLQRSLPHSRRSRPVSPPQRRRRLAPAPATARPVARGRRCSRAPSAGPPRHRRGPARRAPVDTERSAHTGPSPARAVAAPAAHAAPARACCRACTAARGRSASSGRPEGLRPLPRGAERAVRGALGRRRLERRRRCAGGTRSSPHPCARRSLARRVAGVTRPRRSAWRTLV